MSRSEVLQLVARAWCQPNTSHIVMEPELAEAFADILQRQIEEAVKDRWLALRNKIIDKLQDQITDDQLQVVLQIIDDEQWFPAIAEAIRNGEEVEK